MSKKVSIINVATLEGHKDSIYALTGDENGFIFSAGGDGMIVRWDLSKPKDGVLVAKVESSVYALGTHQDGYLIIGNNHRGINVVNMESKEELFSLELPGCGAIFDILCDQEFIYAACQNGVLYQINIKTRNFRGHPISQKSLRSLIFYQQGFAVGDSLGQVIILDKVFNVVDKFLEAQKSVFGIAQYKNELLAVSRDCHLREYLDHKLQNDVVAHIYAINHIVTSPNQEFFATSSQDKTIKIWDLDSKRLLKVIDHARYNGHLNSVNKLFWSRYGNLLVSCSDDRTVKIWQIATI